MTDTRKPVHYPRRFVMNSAGHLIGIFNREIYGKAICMLVPNSHREIVEKVFYFRIHKKLRIIYTTMNKDEFEQLLLDGIAERV